VDPAAPKETTEAPGVADSGDQDGGAAAALPGVGAGNGAPSSDGGGGDAVDPAPVQQGAFFCVRRQVDAAVGEGLSATEELERWRIVRRFLLTFPGHPVIGAIVDLPRKRIKRLAKKLTLGVPVDE